MVAILSILVVLVACAMAVVRACSAASERRAVARLSPGQDICGSASATRRRERRLARDAYLDSLGFVGIYHLVIIFTVASVGGLVLETVWVFLDMGIWQRRYGMVWGPFSPLYGVGAVVLTLALWKLRRQPLWLVFAVSLVVGSCLEQFAGVVMEDGFNAVSWSYAHMPDAITKYVSLRMSVIWGILGCVWCRLLMPELVYLIGEPRHCVQVYVTVALSVFLVLDGVMTVYVVARKDARDQGIAPANAIERYIDERYDDMFIEHRFENLEFEAPC